VQTVEGWQSEYEMAQKFGGLKNPPAIETMMDADLVASLYQDGKLIWPEK
jgi:NitT/TauT family transport system substrate-binding protein